MPPAPNPNIYSFDASIPLSEVLDSLAAMPAELQSLAADSTTEKLTRPPDAEAWSAFRTICHFRDAALIYALRFRWMIFDTDPFLPNYDENNWVASSKDQPDDVPDILDQVAASRADLIRVLSRLSEADWQRTGRHEIAGSIVLEHYVRHQLVHEQQHLEQIRAAMRPAPP
ncbi:MAG: DinB family protein [bacterium]